MIPAPEIGSSESKDDLLWEGSRCDPSHKRSSLDSELRRNSIALKCSDRHSQEDWTGLYLYVSAHCLINSLSYQRIGQD